MKKQKQFGGVTAAVLTPRLEGGAVDGAALRKLLSFLIEKGIHSFALNGATGEYTLTDATQLRALLRVANEVTAGGGQILCGVGAADTATSIAYARIAQESDVAGILLPMPWFFPYQQQDLEQFCRTVSSMVTLPVLLYNLPSFTSAIEQETAALLISSVANIVGIKDSSGSLNIFEHLSRQHVDACRIVGDDRVLAQALQAGLCEGVVSGVAGVAPELVLGLYHQRAQCQSAEFGRCSKALAEVTAQLGAFPTPWGLKIIAQARGLLKASFPLPLSQPRKQQAENLTHWFERSGF